MTGTPWLSFSDRLIASFFGIRGIGCLFYLAYGLQTKGSLWKLNYSGRPVPLLSFYRFWYME